MNLDMRKLWMRTTLKHVQGLCSRNPLILRKSGGAFGDLPIVKAIIGCVKLDVLQWMYERTNGNDGYLFDWKNGKGQTLLHICAQGNRKFQDSSHLLPFLLFSQPHSASVQDEFGKTPLIMQRRTKTTYRSICYFFQMKPFETM